MTAAIPVSLPRRPAGPGPAVQVHRTGRATASRPWRRIHARRDDLLRQQDAVQRIAQRLAPLGERAATTRAKIAGSPVGNGGSRCGCRRRTSTRPAGAAECARAMSNRVPRARRSQHDREPAVVAGTGGGRLRVTTSRWQHEVHVRDRVELRDEVEQQRRRDVVGRLPDHRSLGPSPRSSRKSNSSASARCTRRSPRPAQCCCNDGTTSASISTTSRRPARDRTGAVMAPRPGPTSTSLSPCCGRWRARCGSIVPGSCRKCCP